MRIVVDNDCHDNIGKMDLCCDTSTFFRSQHTWTAVTGSMASEAYFGFFCIGSGVCQNGLYAILERGGLPF